MPRVSRKTLYTALEKASAEIADAGGNDGITSRKEIEAKLKTLSGSEKALVNMYYRFADHRDAVPGARITPADLKKTLAYAKAKLVDAYDKNGNGFSKAEIAKMSTTAKLALAVGKKITGRNID